MVLPHFLICLADALLEELSLYFMREAEEPMWSFWQTLQEAWAFNSKVRYCKRGSSREFTGCGSCCHLWMISRGDGARGSFWATWGRCDFFSTQCSFSEAGMLPSGSSYGRFHVFLEAKFLDTTHFSSFCQFSPPPQHVLSVNLFSLKSARSNLLVFKEESAWRILHPALWVCKSVGFSSYLPATCEL